MELSDHDVLLIVDVQNDFCTGGSLAVREGNAVIPVINALQDSFKRVVATQDWHPPHHSSFASQHGKSPGEVISLNGVPQVLWPDHCIQNTWGADFHPQLRCDKITAVFRKGTDPEIDSYSAFFDNGQTRATGLGEYLEKNGIRRIFVTGLATDYCVKYTVLDGLGLGFQTWVIVRAVRGVELVAGDSHRALETMRQAGAVIVNSGVLAGIA